MMVDTPAAEPLLTISEVAEALNVSFQTARRLVDAGEIPSFKVGPRLRRIRRSDFAAYVERQVAA